jgi:hypothetical protein
VIRGRSLPAPNEGAADRDQAPAADVAGGRAFAQPGSSAERSVPRLLCHALDRQRQRLRGRGLTPGLLIPRACARRSESTESIRRAPSRSKSCLRRFERRGVPSVQAADAGRQGGRCLRITAVVRHGNRALLSASSAFQGESRGDCFVVPAPRAARSGWRRRFRGDARRSRSSPRSTRTRRYLPRSPMPAQHLRRVNLIERSEIRARAKRFPPRVPDRAPMPIPSSSPSLTGHPCPRPRSGRRSESGTTGPRHPRARPLRVTRPPARRRRLSDC